MITGQDESHADGGAMGELTVERIRKALLSAVEKCSRSGPANLQGRPVLKDAAEQLGILNDPEKKAVLLDVWNDLFRQGHIGWGMDIGNPDPPFCHLTARGREFLSNVSRDPANPEGYIRSLESRTTLNPIAKSYIAEALQTHNNNCFKATAVMVGCAAESLVLELRDAIVLRLQDLNRSVPSGLKDWRIFAVLRAIQKTLNTHEERMPRELRETYEAHWPAFVSQIRRTRNEAGHPLSVDPVSSDAVHSALLLFPELAVLTGKMKEWVSTELR